MQPLKLAVIGHTNTGKTSLLRTLLRDRHFGEISHQAATTRHVERASIQDSMQQEAGQPITEDLIWIFDTPGLEDASGLLEWLEDNTQPRVDGIERIKLFLADAIAQTDYAQEAKVLRQLVDSDMALYVIDAREPILTKYKDELTLLSWCARPVMPTFNFIENQDLTDWREMLARRTLHVSSSFDTVAFDFKDEMQLWTNLATMLPDRAMLQRLIEVRQQEWQHLQQQAYTLIAHFLINVAAYQQQLTESDDAADNKQRTKQAVDSMQQQIRQLERQLQAALLNEFRFYQQDLTVPADALLSTYAPDPFDAEQLKQYGIKTGSGAAAGAAVGLGIDAAMLGTSLGLGAVLGGVIGGVLPHTRALSERWRGIRVLHIDEATVTLLAMRALGILKTLMKRGHAAQVAAEVDVLHLPEPWPSGNFPAILRKARTKPAWSELNSADPKQAKLLRQDAAESLAEDLQQYSLNQQLTAPPSAWHNQLTQQLSKNFPFKK